MSTALCVPLAEERFSGRDAPYDAQRAALLIGTACQLGLGNACERAAELTVDDRQVTDLLRRGCDSNDLNACFKLGELLLKQTHPPDANSAQGKAHLTQACDHGIGRACTVLVDALGRDYAGEAAPPRKVQDQFVRLFERGCGGGDPSACFTLAKIARRGIIGPVDLVAAKRWMHAGCVLDPGAEFEIAVQFGGADPSLLSDLAEAGCTDQPPPPAPPRPSLCTH